MQHRKLLDHIMGAMTGSAQVQTLVKKKPKRYDTAGILVQEDDEAAEEWLKLQTLLDAPATFEIEVGFGTYRAADEEHKASFSPGLFSITQFEKLLKVLKRECPSFKTYNDRVEISSEV